jgi:hypothetical protein
MEYMFTMMNNERLGVGTQGLAIAERAYQHAGAFARERVQSRALGSADMTPVPIIQHPDVRRMLMTMKACIAAMRALAYTVAGDLDRSKRHPDDTVRAEHHARVDLLTPVTKAWVTDCACEIASLGVQIHGGMGFIEETGAAQYYRDARILPIYEGTNGIQALDLVNRKLLRDKGAAIRTLLGEMAATLNELEAAPCGEVKALRDDLARGVETLRDATDWLLEAGAADPARAAAGASPYLRLFGWVSGGWLLARCAMAAAGRIGNGDADGDAAFVETKIATAMFYNANLLPRAQAEAAALRGAATVLALDEAQI